MGWGKFCGISTSIKTGFCKRTNLPASSFISQGTGKRCQFLVTRLSWRKEVESVPLLRSPSPPLMMSSSSSDVDSNGLILSSRSPYSASPSSPLALSPANSSSSADYSDDEFLDLLDMQLSRRLQSTPQAPKSESEGARDGVFRSLPQDVVLKIVCEYLPTKLKKVISKATLIHLQQPQRKRVINQLMRKLCQDKGSLPPLGEGFVRGLEGLVFAGQGKLLTPSYHSTMRGILGSFSSCRSYSKGPMKMYNSILEGATADAIYSIISKDPLSLQSTAQLALRTTLLTKRKQECILPSSLHATRSRPYGESCESCGGSSTRYTIKQRKQQVDRGRCVVWCEGCNHISEL